MLVAAIQGRLQKFQKKHIAEVNDYEDQYPSDDDIMVQMFRNFWKGNKLIRFHINCKKQTFKCLLLLWLQKT